MTIRAASCRCWAQALGTALLAGSCLPVDNRPPPARLLQTASADEHLLEGVSASETVDGWSIRYERFLVSVGDASAEGDSCIEYADPDYLRVLNMLEPGAQKVGIVYALGHCDLEFDLSNPHADSVLGEGVTDQDRTFMRTPGTDAFSAASAVSIFVQGTASKDGTRKTFAWAYRQRIEYSKCGETLGGRFVQGIDLPKNADVTVDLTVHGGTLFHDSLDDDVAAIGFQVFADADTVSGNDDGEVTLDELGSVALTEMAVEPGRYADAEESWTALADYVYLGLFPLVVRYRGDGSCEQEISPNERDPQ